ncbi:MAG: HAD family phosphatase [Akkermansiaceae bacterium]|nr:HAD family phosphatase [Akkermansiaceae bacterium]
MTFLFDLGRVLYDFDFAPSLARLLPAGIPDAEERIGKLLERKDEFETGKIDVESYITWALQVLGSDATHEEFCHAWREIFTPNEPMLKIIRQLVKDGHRLIVFSNINGIHYPWIFENFPDLSLFHGAILSHETGFIKPQHEIYQYAIERYNLIPEETPYIDDLPQNIAAGRELGFPCWQYDLKNHAAFEVWLAGILK